MTSSVITSIGPCAQSMNQRKTSRLTTFAVKAVRGYQYLAAGRPSPCRFYPSCSEYAYEALTEHGVRRGSWLAMRRVLRCNPFGRHGVDLVPIRREETM